MKIDFINKREKIIALTAVIMEAMNAIEKTLDTIPVNEQKEFKAFVVNDARMQKTKKEMEAMDPDGKL